VIRGHEKAVTDVIFDPEGRWLASCSMDNTVRLWPLEGDVPLPGRILLEDPNKHMLSLAATPDGR
jgi:WD40 repeat protein